MFLKIKSKEYLSVHVRIGARSTWSPPRPPATDRSIEGRRAARLKRFKGERLIIDYLNCGVSVREIAVKLGVTEKRMRAIVNEALAAHMPTPPEEFAAMQISRLNEALPVAYSAMSGMNLKAVDGVVRIMRELDRYHGFFPAARRAHRDERQAEAKVEEPRRLLARRPQMAPQGLKSLSSRPETRSPRSVITAKAGIQSRRARTSHRSRPNIPGYPRARA